MSLTYINKDPMVGEILAVPYEIGDMKKEDKLDTLKFLQKYFSKKALSCMQFSLLRTIN